MAAEVPLSVQQLAPPWELTGVIGTVIMVIGVEIVSIIGTTVIAGSVHQAADHMWCRLDIAVDASSCLRILTGHVRVWHEPDLLRCPSRVRFPG